MRTGKKTSMQTEPRSRRRPSHSNRRVWSLSIRTSIPGRWTLQNRPIASKRSRKRKATEKEKTKEKTKGKTKAKARKLPAKARKLKRAAKDKGRRRPKRK